jgi:catalase (peroxidase I)
MDRMAYVNGSWTTAINRVSNEYFQVLLGNHWTAVTNPSSRMVEYTNADASLFMTPTDMRLLWSPDLKNIAQHFAEDNERFLQRFVSGWTKLMNADRFDGPVANLCDDTA